MDDERVALATDVARQLRGRCVACAESLTAGRVASALAMVEGAVDFLRGGLVAYQPAVKASLLRVTADSVLSLAAAEQMALGAAQLLDRAVERRAADGELVRKLLHVDRAIAQELPPCPRDDGVVRDHAPVGRHMLILAVGRGVRRPVGGSTGGDSLC